MTTRRNWALPLPLVAAALGALAAVGSGNATAQVENQQQWGRVLQDGETELEPSLWAEVEAFATDNVDRAELGSEDNVAVARVGGTLVRESGRLTAALRSDLEYRHYLRNTYDDETLLNLDLVTRATLVEERMFWVLEDTFGQLLTDTLLPDVVTNRGDINVLRTGPDLVLRLSEQLRLEASARYQDSYFEATDLDGSSLGGSIGAYRLLGDTDTLGLQADYTEYTPDLELRPEYTVSRATAQWQRRSGSNLAVLEAGVGRLEALGNSSSQAVGTFTLNKSLRSNFVLELSISRDLSDSSDLFLDIREDASGQGVLDLTARQLPVQTTRSDVALRWERQRTELWVQVGWLDEKPDRNFGAIDALGNRTTRATRATLERRLSTQTTLSLAAEYLKRDYERLTQGDANTTASISYERRFGRHVTGQLGYQYWRRTSDDSTRSFSENRFRLTFRYAWR